MTTLAPEPTRWLAQQIIRHYDSAVLSGIVPNADHLRSGGYHVSIEDLARNGNGGDYSNRRALDRSPPVTAAGRRLAAAHDISLSRADMVRLHGRVRAVWLARASDTRTRYVNAVNCWDGSGAAVRYDFVAGTAGTATADHRWHEHTDQPRAYVDTARDSDEAWKAARAVLSIVTGQSHAAWLEQEDEMTEAELIAAVVKALRSTAGQAALGTGAWNHRENDPQTISPENPQGTRTFRMGGWARTQPTRADQRTAAVLAAVAAAQDDAVDEQALAAALLPLLTGDQLERIVRANLSDEQRRALAARLAVDEVPPSD
ncbi:hypothetical protein [Spirilliplanes yamanashiensis]|uniref:Uncharacterized protein n=1 Tax=Spirilliplanes yamanashiensis TaxID=42233 RepID=A0A8J3Y7L3_9ACTN|nr:hypothetical protein [Spirilliplanes yamanashiensis]MDP9815137.1 hypothetical protein [Spirilliplanes yamanashiensis]GIJ02792.1 hypothetical protein Sya03_21440 [Spirilliplanes yamanashiensis]